MLELGTFGWGHMLTLADRNVAAVVNDRFESSWAYVALVSTMFGILVAPFDWRAYLISGAGAGLQILAARWKRRSRILSERDFRSQIATELREIGRGNGRACVLRCPSDQFSQLWRDIIEYLANHVDVAIISGDEESNHLQWEISVLRAGGLSPQDFVVLRTSAESNNSEAIDTLLVHSPAVFLRSLTMGRFAENARRVGTAVGAAILAGRSQLDSNKQ